MEENIRSLFEKLQDVCPSLWECKEVCMKKSLEGANHYQSCLGVDDTKGGKKYFEFILRVVEQKILKPWSDSQDEFIVLTCHEDASLNEVNLLSALSAFAFVKGDTMYLEKMQTVVVQYQRHPSAGFLLNNLGVMLSENLLYEKSEECFTLAKSCFAVEHEHLMDAVATLNIAILHRVFGDYQKARHFCDIFASLCHKVSMKTTEDAHLPERLLRRGADMFEEFGNYMKCCDILWIGVHYDISSANKTSTVDLTKWLMKVQLKEQNGEEIQAEEMEHFVSYLLALMDKPTAELLNAEFIRTVMIAAKIYHNIGPRDIAGQLLEKLKTSFLLVHGGEKTLYGSLLCQIGRFKLGSGQFSEAESVLKQAEEILINNCGRSHHAVASCKSLLGSCALLKDNTKDAMKHLNEALTVFKNINYQHPEAAEILLKFALLYTKEGNFQSVQKTMQEAMDIFISACGEISPKTASGYFQAAMILAKVDEFKASAVDKVNKAIKIFIGLGLRPDHPDVMLCYSLLGVLQLSLDKSDQAEEFFVDIQKQVPILNDSSSMKAEVIFPEVKNLFIQFKSDHGSSRYHYLSAQVVSLVNLVHLKTGDERKGHLDALVTCLLEHETEVLEIWDFAGQDVYCVSHRVSVSDKPVFLILSTDPKPNFPSNDGLNSDSVSDTLESNDSSDSNMLLLSSAKKVPFVVFWRIPHNVEDMKELESLDSAFRESVSTIFLQPKFGKGYEDGQTWDMELTIPTELCDASFRSSLYSLIDRLPLLIELELSLESDKDCVNFDYLKSSSSVKYVKPSVHVSYFSFKFSNKREAEFVFDHLIHRKLQTLNKVQGVRISNDSSAQNIAVFLFRDPNNSSLSIFAERESVIVKCRTLEESESKCICSSVRNALEDTMESLCEVVRVDYELSVELPCVDVATDDDRESSSNIPGVKTKPTCSAVASESVNSLTCTSSGDPESYLKGKPSLDLQNQDVEDAPPASHLKDELHTDVHVDVCLCLLDCLLNDRLVSPDEESLNSSAVSVFSSCDSSVQDKHNHSIFSVGSSASLNSLPVSPSAWSSDGHCLLMPQKLSSESLSSAGELKGSNSKPLAEQNNSEESTCLCSKHLSENSSTPVECSAMCVKWPAKPSQFSDGVVLSSYEEVYATGGLNSETKEPNQFSDFPQLHSKVSEEESLRSFDCTGGVQSIDTETSVVHDKELLPTKCHGGLHVNLNPEHDLSAEPAVGIPEPSLVAVSEESGSGTLTSECLRLTLANLEDELATSWNQCHELRQQIRQLEEQMKQSEAEKQQLQAELGRYQFLEDKERRSEQVLLSSMARGRDQDKDSVRPCAAAASPGLKSMDGRLLGGAALLREPGFSMQARLLEISNSLSEVEVKQIKLLAKGKVNGFRLARIRQGIELFEELERRGEFSSAYIWELLAGIQRYDLQEKLGMALPRTEKGADHPSSQSMLDRGSAANSSESIPSQDNSLDLLQERYDKAEHLSGEASLSSGSVHFQGGEGSELRTQENDGPISSSGSSAENSSDMPVLSLNEDGSGSFSESALNPEECTLFASSSDDGFLSGARCSATVSSSDSFVSSAHTTQTAYSNGTSQDSYDGTQNFMPVNPCSAITTTNEISSDSGLNPTSSSEEEIPKRSQLSSDDDEEKPENGDAVAKNEELEERTVDLCDGAARPMQSETRTSTVGARTNSTDSSAGYAENILSWSQQGAFPDDELPVRTRAAGASSGPPTDWERLGARPKRVQVQRPLAEQVPQETISPVTDGLTGDFLARHSQDKALHESLYQDSADVPLFSDTPSQDASYINGMTNVFEHDKAKLYFRDCQAALGTDPYSRLDVSGMGNERSGLLGGFSCNGQFNGNSVLKAGPWPSHLGGSNVSIHGNYSPSNASSAASSYSLQSGFVHNASRFGGVEHFGRAREPFIPLDGNTDTQHGLYLPAPRNELVYSGMTGSSFADGIWTGTVGIQPGHPVYGAQQYSVFSDNTTSTITPEQRQTPQSATLIPLNQSQSTSNNDRTLSSSTENTACVDTGNSGNARIDVGNSGSARTNLGNSDLPAQYSASMSNGSEHTNVTRSDSTRTNWPALICGNSNTMTVGNEIVIQGTADGNTEGGDEPCGGAVNNSSSSSVLNRDFGTDSVESTDNSLLALEQRVAEACALVERVLREREEREEFGREIERKEQQIREQRARERREREAREMMEAERWPQQQDAITPRSQWLCEHYQRHCRVRFPCCTQFYPCHRCHNNSRACDNEEAKACHATHLKCSHCHHEQEIGEDSAKCRKCGGKMSAYFCPICKHFTSVDKNPYHCEKCGICRIHKDKSFHCEVCNVCLDRRLEGNHKCRPDSGHDECCICLEDAFSGCQILPCSHKVHRECAIAMIQNSIRTCPICRHPLYSPPSD